ncbi:uncharacterized protein [Typha angustifolia]|uniref:uncharacterized protein n=1 Tax=Typha angustifolia TaxID=59011 RepID=UPI003C2E31B6
MNHIEEDNSLEVQAELSFHSLADKSTPKTLRVEGMIKKKKVLILIDSGSTHNFVDLWMVRRLGLESEPSNGFDVIIGDSTMLRTEGICHKKFADVFQQPHGLPPPRAQDHCIEILLGAGPANVRPYQYPFIQKEAISKMVQEMLSSGVIRPSRSSYSSLVLLVRKKDGSWRFCVDYQALNSIIVKDWYTIPVIEELLNELASACYFSMLDLRARYHQIRAEPSDVHKMAFRTHDGHYKFLVMSFDLTNALATFQSLMNDIFRPHLRQYVLIFFDDILVYNYTWEEHLGHLRTILGLLRQHELKAKDSKCSWGQQRVDYLGHIILKDDVEANPKKI